MRTRSRPAIWRSCSWPHMRLLPLRLLHSVRTVTSAVLQDMMTPLGLATWDVSHLHTLALSGCSGYGLWRCSNLFWLFPRCPHSSSPSQQGGRCTERAFDRGVARRGAASEQGILGCLLALALLFAFAFSSAPWVSTHEIDLGAYKRVPISLVVYMAWVERLRLRNEKREWDIIRTTMTLCSDSNTLYS